MSVHLVPNNALCFNRPFTQLTQKILLISNMNSTPVAFKVLTTAPKLYCVRPNAGRIEPGDSAEVVVMLQPMKEDPPLSARCKDKFLVLSTVITPEKEGMELHSFFNTPSGAVEKWNIYRQKLRVVYLPPESPSIEEEEESDTEEPSPVPGSRSIGIISKGATQLTSSLSSPRALPRSLMASQHSMSGAAIVNANLARPLPPVPDLAAREKQDLEQRLSDAHEEIERLRALLARSGDGADSVMDGRTHTSTPKSLASGVESMVAVLKNFVHPLANSQLPAVAHN